MRENEKGEIVGKDGMTAQQRADYWNGNIPEKVEPKESPVLSQEELDLMGEEVARLAQFEPFSDKYKSLSQEFTHEYDRKETHDALVRAEADAQRKEKNKTGGFHPAFEGIPTSRLEEMMLDAAKRPSEYSNAIKAIGKELKDRENG